MATQTAIGSGSTVNNGGTVINGGTVDSSSTVTNSVSIMDNLKTNSGVYGALPVANSTDTRIAYSAGTFAYNNNVGVIRHHSNTISGISSTILEIPGSELAGRVAIHERSANNRNHITARFLDGTVTKGGNDGDAVSFGADHAAQPTRAIPGELVYMDGSLLPKQDDYKAKTG